MAGADQCMKPKAIHFLVMHSGNKSAVFVPNKMKRVTFEDS